MTSRILFVRLNNRLGNQMFQYAFARTVMLRMNITQCYLVGQEESRLDCFALAESIQYINCFDDLPFLTKFAARFMGKLAELLSNQPAALYKAERLLQPLINYCGVYFCLDGYLPFQEKKLCGKNLYCSGYFQSEKYFEDYQDQIRKDFSFSKEIVSTCESLASQIQSCTAVCLHVRQGDYLSSSRHQVCDTEYYQRAITEMQQYHPDAHFFLFSDDTERASQIISNQLFSNLQITVVPSSFTDQQSLYLGTLCRHHILSNSSFSWWMQYLARNNNQLVIAPRRWMNDDTPIALYGPSWLLL